MQLQLAREQACRVAVGDSGSSGSLRNMHYVLVWKMLKSACSTLMMLD
jgi:hypothetical protein